METVPSTVQTATWFHRRPKSEQPKVRPSYRTCWASQKLVTRFLRDLAPSWMAPLRITQTTVWISSKKVPAERVTQGQDPLSAVAEATLTWGLP